MSPPRITTNVEEEEVVFDRRGSEAVTIAKQVSEKLKATQNIIDFHF